MNIIIRGRNVPLSQSLEDHCRERVRRAVRRFAEQVARVEVVLVDLNGPRNAPAQACRVFVTLDSGGRLMFESSDRDFYLAVSRATSGAGRHLARVLSKWRTHLRAPASMAALA